MQDFKYVSTTIWIPLLNNGILFAFRRPFEKIILPCFTLEIKEYSWFSCCLKCCVEMNDRSWSLRSLCVPWKQCKTPKDEYFWRSRSGSRIQKKSHSCEFSQSWRRNVKQKMFKINVKLFKRESVVFVAKVKSRSFHPDVKSDHKVTITMLECNLKQERTLAQKTIGNCLSSVIWHRKE